LCSADLHGGELKHTRTLSAFGSPCLSFLLFTQASLIKSKKETPALRARVLVCFVGVRGLEPPASTSRTWRASQLRYTPNNDFHPVLDEIHPTGAQK